MRLAVKNRSLIATILVITVAVAALAVLCADGIHVPLTGGVGVACAAMTHATGLGAASDTDVASVALMFIAAVAGFALTFNAAFARPASRRFAVSFGQSADPLNGRLRL